MDQKEQLNPNLSVRDTFFVIWYGTILWFLNNIDAFLYIQQVRDSSLIAEDVVQ
ncbi:MAG: hypothetical protein JSV68_14215 [Anaerolineaceae bacterium]|nr:MAG: hypothetical protein JSV68_14215 [Anaerolineaceae bacterium]